MSTTPLDLLTQCKSKQYAIKVHMVIQSKIKTFIDDSPLSQVEIAKNHGMDKTELNRVIHSTRVSLSKLYEVAHKLGILSGDPLTEFHQEKCTPSE